MLFVSDKMVCQTALGELSMSSNALIKQIRRWKLAAA